MTISWLMGVFIFAFLVGQIRDIVATATQSRTQYRQLMDQTVMYMRNLNLPDELQRRVRMWLNHNWEQQKTFNVSRILDTLPRKMKTDVAINVHYKTLVKVQLFKDCDKALLRDLVLQLRPVLFLPGDFICRKGEVGKEMYIVNKGIVEVLGGEDGDVVLATLAKGSVFGEISLLGIPGCNRRTADVRSKGFSNLFVLSKDDLWEALKNYPEAQKVLKKKAKNIIKENEARARATRGHQESITAITDVSRHDDSPSYTPKLVRTVLQVLPKSCHRIQPQPSISTKGSFTPIESPRNTFEISRSNTGNTPSTSNKASFKNLRITSAPPLLKPSILTKPRSMSVGALKNLSASLERSKKSDILDNKSPEFPISTKKISPTKSEPCSYRRLNNSEESPSNIAFSPVLQLGMSAESQHKPLRPTTSQHQADHPNSCDGSESESNMRTHSFDHKPEDEEFSFDYVKDVYGSEDSSEASSTSTQKMIIDNSDDENSNCNDISSSSSTPYLGGLFHYGSSQSFQSSGKDIRLLPLSKEGTDSCSDAKMATKPQKMLMEKGEGKNSSSSSSNSSSLLCLGGLFRHGSSQSFNSSNKEYPLSPLPIQDIEDGDSTNGSSSAGYDNLAFVPTGILSRRSSIFSDISG